MPEDARYAASYKETVDRVMVQRARIAFIVALVLHPMAGYLDYTTYPPMVPLFFGIRLLNCLVLGILFLLTFSARMRKQIAWIASIGLMNVAAGIIAMIYLSNGAKSHYYEGVNLVIIGTLITNSFYFRHSVGFCSVILALYTAACLGNWENWSFPGYFFGAFFILSTSIITTIVTRLFGREHGRAYVSNTKLSEMYSQADTLSKIDDLTQIYNRRYFTKLLAEKIRDSRTTLKPFYLVFFDIDKFKDINDQHGHLAGDRAIQAIVDQVRNQIRTTSRMGRYGGDEFMFFIDMVDRKAFLERMNQIRQRVHNFKLIHEGKTIPLSVSFGAVFVDPDKYQDAQDVIDVADQALLDVKKTKRGEIYLVE